MSPLRQQILEAIDRTSDEDLYQVSHLLESLKRSSAMPSSPSVQTWQTVLDRLEQFTPENSTNRGKRLANFYNGGIRRRIQRNIRRLGPFCKPLLITID